MLLFLTWPSLSHVCCSWWWCSKSIGTSFGLLRSENSMFYSGSMILFLFLCHAYLHQIEAITIITVYYVVQGFWKESVVLALLPISCPFHMPPNLSFLFSHLQLNFFTFTHFANMSLSYCNNCLNRSVLQSISGFPASFF